MKLFFMAMVLCSIRSALAQDTFEPPPFKQLRYAEDYSYLRDPAKRTDVFDRIKFIPLSEDKTVFLTLGGEVRERYEFFENNLWGQGPQDDDGYLLQRYMLHLDAHFGEYFRLFSQFKSGLETGRDGGPRPADRDEFDVHQLFFDLKPLASRSPLTIRIGRQELSYGSSRLISVRESPNVRQSFDGFKVFSRFGDWDVDAFAVRPVETNPGVFDDGPDPERSLWGVYMVRPIPFIEGAHIDLYYLGLEREEARFDEGNADELRHSIGTRLWGTRGNWDYNFEAVGQFGTFGAGEILAWTIASDTGFTFDEVSWKPRVGLKADITSGDRNPGDGNLETFNPLFPKGAYFSETSLVGPANHIDLHPSIEVHPSKTLKLSLDWDVFWRESKKDGIYGNAVNLVRSGAGSDASYVGNQLQCLVEWEMNRHLTLNGAYAHFFAGRFLKETRPGEDVDYASAWITFKF
jgi:hypothetical protein